MSVLRHCVAEGAPIGERLLVDQGTKSRVRARVCAEVGRGSVVDGASEDRIPGGPGAAVLQRAGHRSDRARPGYRSHTQGRVRTIEQATNQDAVVVVGMDLHRAGQSIVGHQGSVGIHTTATA